MGKNILVLGGGFGGLAAAHTLRKGLGPEHKITVVDQQQLFFMGLTKLWVLDGTRAVGEGSGNRRLLGKAGIDFVEGQVTTIDPKGKLVQVGRRSLGFDYLIVALGADYLPSATVGFSKNAKNLYLESGCAQIRDILRSTVAGSITILVCGLPFKCPPAPYEATMIIDTVLRKRGVRDSVKLQVITPEPHPLTILGPDAGKAVRNLLEEKGIEYHPSEKVKEIKPKSVSTESGEFSHDLVFAVPVHVVPSVIREAGLSDQSGWIPVDPRTLTTQYAGVYAIGDCAGPKTPRGPLLPRAGILAEQQGKVVAGNLIHEILGDGKNDTFDGKGACFMEVGDGRAAPVRANFYAEPDPQWELTPPSENGFLEKRRFLEERMAAWFG